MPSSTQHWDGIADSSVQAEAVWLYRTAVRASSNSTSVTVYDASASKAPAAPAPAQSAASIVWKPMRKVDCQALNRALIPATTSNGPIVYTEGGRSTADVSNNTLRYNFVRGPERVLCHSVWFVREEKSSGGKESVILHPVTDPIDAALMETLYQRAVVATASLGPGIASLLAEEVPLHSEANAKIQICKVGDVLTLRKISTGGWQLFGSSVVLQRGYGEYSVPGEEVETALGPVRHVMFVVHGIGEALFSRDDVKVAGLVDQVNSARMELQRKQLARYQKECQDVLKRNATKSTSSSTPTSPGTSATPLPAQPSRVELIPIEWYHCMHDSNSDLMKSLQATTLQTIPALRAIANDVVFDVLMYLTPAFCQSVLETVTRQINTVYATFQVVHPEFTSSGGTVSLAGHSLGSVICWDLLALLKQQQEGNLVPPTVPTSQPEETLDEAAAPIGNETSNQVFQPACCAATVLPNETVAPVAASSNSHATTMPAYGPTLLQPLSETIAFVPEHTLFLGSPLGLFLTLRGAHAYFDSLRGAEAVSPFALPTKRLYNIFHPSDPVAYRIEPLLMAMGSDTVPPPMYLTVPGGEVRLHVKAMQLGDVVRKSLFEPKRNGASSWGSLAESLGRHVIDQSKSEAASKSGLTFALGGKSGRVDFGLQPGLIENDYISAVTAHSSYFAHADIQDFLIGLFSMEDK